jgi:anti-sigma B factor antagonist
LTAVQEPASETTFFSIDFEVVRDVLALHGALDLATVAALDAAIDVVGSSRTDLVLDLSDLQFVDSTGLTRFVMLHRRLGEHGARLVLRHPKANVRKVLAVTGLDTLFGVED